jgi:hypothetical protein
VGDRVGQKAAIRIGLTPLRRSPAQSVHRFTEGFDTADLQAARTLLV